MDNNVANAIMVGIASAGILAYILSLGFTILLIVAEWKMFVKAGEEGWKAIIPIYNTYTMYKIIYGNGWKFLLLLIPVFGGIVSIAAMIRLAQVYGKGVGFGILNIFFAPITMCILGFGSSTYQGSIDSFI